MSASVSDVDRALELARAALVEALQAVLAAGAVRGKAPALRDTIEACIAGVDRALDVLHDRPARWDRGGRAR